MPTPVGQSDEWITALNAKFDLPLPLRPCGFVDAGYNAAGAFEYNGGVGLRPARGIFEVYVPFFFSDGIKNALEVNDVSFTERIRFTLYLNEINPRHLIKSFEI